ncbi:MAG TPA: penicillin-binding protein 2 [Acidimicrobiales bacterium]|nr:penicillin-binding protein 2 [Acidimicrobiales bacterium]
MSDRPVTGAFDAYRAQRAGGPAASGRRRPSPRPARSTSSRSTSSRSTSPRPAPARPAPAPRSRTSPRSTRPPESRRTTPAAARRLVPGRGERAGRGAGAPPPPRATRRRLLALPVVSVLLFGVVAAKLVDVQVRNPDRWVAQGLQQRIAVATLPAGRGSLLDRNGHHFSLSLPRRSVFADPSLIHDPAAVAARLAPLLEVPRRELEEKVSGPGRFAMLAHTLPDAVADRVEALDIAGISFVAEYQRFRPNDTLAQSLVGSVSVDGSQGISGLEAQYDDLLTGREGEITYEKAKVEGGGAIAGSTRRVIAARPGADITLTLDRGLQYETEQTLADHLGRAGAHGGTAIVSRPSTGEILALANLEQDEGGAGYVPTTNNLALTTVYEPGSVNKVITVAAALEEGLVTPETMLSVPDELEVGDHRFTDSHPHPTTSWSVTDILATSSNIGTIMLAQQLGGDRMDRYLRRFGFGSRTGLGFPAESAGLMLPGDEWAQQSTAIGSIPIGQGISVTALQMLQAYNVLANDGTYVPPRLVRAVTRPDGTPEPVPSPEPVQVVSPTTAAAVRAMMAEVVERGTGQDAAVPGYTVAGKTGTARKPQPNGGYEDEDGAMHYIATFAGLLPAENPDLSVIVVVDEPDPGRSIYAGDVAAPAFSDLARLALRRLDIPPAVGGGTVAVPTMSESAQGIGDTRIPSSGAAPDEGAAREEDAAGVDPGDGGDPDGG